MNYRWDPGFHSDEPASESAATNRILRLVSGATLAVAEAAPLDFAPTRLEHVEAEHRLCLPEGYEPGYAYPLIVWLHDDGSDAEEIDQILPKISERNYLGVALQGNVVAPARSGWSSKNESLPQILVQLHEVVEAVAERFPIHPHRKYLAGFGSGGTLAWEVLLREPGQWAGAICLSGDFPQIDHPLAMFRELQQRRLLVSTGLDCPAEHVTELINAGRLMYSAGIQVGTRMYDSGRRAPTDKMLRDVDRWIMDSIATAIH